MLPIALAAAVGAVTPFFLDRTVTAEAWAPILAVAFVVDAAARRWRALGAVAAAVTVLLCVSGTLTLLSGTWFYDLTVEHLRAGAAARRRDRGGSELVLAAHRLATRRPGRARAGDADRPSSSRTRWATD